MKRLAYNIKKIVNKLYSTIPLVPSNCLIQNIIQDIQYGLYDECGDPNENWDLWKKRCVYLLNQRNILSCKTNNKLATHDTESRTCAIVYVNGKLFEGESHNEALQNYLNSNDIEIKQGVGECERYYLTKELDTNSNLDNIEFACLNKIDKQDFNELLYCFIDYYYSDRDDYFDEHPGDYIPGNAIFIESDTIQNTSIENIVEVVKKYYPNHSIYDEDYLEPFNYSDYKKIARLKKVNYHDNNDRECAVVYIDGLFFEAETHNEALTEYTNLNNIRRTNNPSSYKREVLEEELNNNCHFEDKEFCCLNKVIFDPIERCDVKRIFIDDKTMQNINMNELISHIKSEYPQFEIFIDNDNTCAHDMDNYQKVGKKLKKIIKKSEKINLKDILSDENIEWYGLNTDYGNRDFAITYLDGKLYEGDVHKDTVEEYLNENNMDPDIYLNYSEGFVTNDEQDDIDLPMGFASYIKGKDGKDYVTIYPGSVYYIGTNEFAEILQKKYPNAIICVDDNDRYTQQNDVDVYIEKI